MILAKEYNQVVRSKKKLRKRIILTCDLKNQQKLSEDWSIGNFKTEGTP